MNIQLDNGKWAHIILSIRDEYGEKLNIHDLTRQDIIEISIEVVKQLNNAFDNTIINILYKNFLTGNEEKV